MRLVLFVPFHRLQLRPKQHICALVRFFLSRDYSKHSSPHSERIAQGERQHKLECLFVCISVDFSISMIHLYCTYRMIGSDGELRVPGPEHKLLQASNGPAPAARFVPLQVLLGKTGTHGSHFYFYYLLYSRCRLSTDLTRGDD